MQADNRAMAKMDLELWMQEDGTNMFGAVLYSADIFDRGTAERAAAHILVRFPNPCTLAVWCSCTHSSGNCTSTPDFQCVGRASVWARHSGARHHLSVREAQVLSA